MITFNLDTVEDISKCEKYGEYIIKHKEYKNVYLNIFQVESENKANEIIDFYYGDSKEDREPLEFYIINN